MPKREKEVQVKMMNEEDIKYWAQNIVSPSPQSEDERRDEQLAHRVINLADMTSFVTYLIRVNSQELYHAMKQQATDIIVLRNVIIDELGVSEEKLEEYEKEVRDKLEANQRVMEKLQEMQARGEDITEEDLAEINKELEALEPREEE